MTNNNFRMKCKTNPRQIYIYIFCRCVYCYYFFLLVSRLRIIDRYVATTKGDACECACVRIKEYKHFCSNAKRRRRKKLFKWQTELACWSRPTICGISQHHQVIFFLFHLRSTEIYFGLYVTQTHTLQTLSVQCHTQVTRVSCENSVLYCMRQTASTMTAYIFIAQVEI